MFGIAKRYTFEASHQLPEHDGKCRDLHGHSYRVTVRLTGERLMQTGPEQGMLFDYGRLDAAVKPIIDALDHKHLNDMETVFGEPLYPTAENIAEYLAVRICRALWPTLKERGLFLWVDVSETPKSSATYELDMSKAQAFCGPIE